MSNEFRIKAVKREISMREDLLQLQQENNSEFIGTNRRKLSELRKTLTELECNHVTERTGGITRNMIPNNYCPKCGKFLLVGE